MIIKNKKGFTLVEILVALFLTGLVMAGLVGIWVSASNFSSSARDEVMFKNLYSLVAKRLQKDITEANITSTSPSSCANGNVSFLRLYQNYVPSQSACIIQTSKKAFTEYCYNDTTKKMYRVREEKACSASFSAGVCLCTVSDNDLALTNLLAQPVASGDGSVANGINIYFTTEVLVGKNKRPVKNTYSKTFGQLAGN